MTIYVFGGAGMLGYWQLGCADVRVPAEVRTDPTTKFVGASAGATTAALLACNVNLGECVDAGIAAMRRANAFTRYLGLVGIGARIVRDFLESVLPQDAHKRCTGRLHVFVQRFPCVDDLVSVFATRRELIETVVASGYIPFFGGPSPCTCLSGMLTYDGAINLRRVEMLVFGTDERYVFIDYKDDPGVAKQSFIRAHSPEWVWEVYEKGRAFGEISNS